MLEDALHLAADTKPGCLGESGFFMVSIALNR